uniref:putative barnase/colicin E5 family endoribonuclease n=1 Tax=Helicobacter felis TaxID=214 RepID=UPI0013CE0A7A
GLRVFDSQAFFKRLETLKEGTFSSQASKDFIDIASGFNRLFNQDAKIAAALKANTGEQVGSSIATSVSGAVQYQVTKALFGLVVRTMFHIPFAKSINSKVSQAALRYHIKAALNKSVSVGDFKQHLRALGQRVEFDNATKALIREIEGGLPPDDTPPDGGGGGMLPPKSEGSEGGKPLKEESNLKEGNHGNDSITNIDTEQALKILENAPRAQIPKNLDIEGFLKSLEGVENKENFIKHLQKKTDNQSRLAYLNLVEPTLKEWDLKLTKGERSEFIKGFSDGNGEFFSLLITQENDKRLITFIPKTRLKFLQSKIKDADLIQTFTGRAGDSVWPRIGEDSTDRLKDTPLDFDQIKEYARQQATTLFNTAKEQEAGFKELLEGLVQPNSTLEAGNLLKSVSSIEEKLAYYGADVSRVDDLLRGAFIAPKQSVNTSLEHILGMLEANPSIKDISPRFIQTQDNYKGAHINFTYNDIPSEIQLHTPKSWEAKKKQDPYYKELRREKLKPTLTKSELKKLRRKVKELGQESDLDISLFASSRLTSPQYSPVQSELVTKSAVDLNATQEPPLNSKAGSSSASGNAYNRLDSKLNQKSTSLTGGKGIDIQTPLAQDSIQGLKDKPLLLTYKNTQELVTHAKAEGLSPARIGQLVQERKQAIAGLLPFKREVDINSVIFKEDIKNNAQIVLEGRQAYLSHAQLLQALSKAKELRSTSPSAHTLVQHKQSRLAQLQDRTLAYEWLKAFNLKSLDEPFIPQFSPAVQQALEPILKGEQIQLTRGSLVKLAKRQREEFLPLIRPTLESPNAVLDNGRGILFIKEFIGADKNRYFMSVAKNYSGEWVFSSHMRKDFSAIKNEFKRSKVLYNAGFSGGEVAGASDILESGGTAIKPSDLQINTPPSHSSALNPAKPEFSTPALKGKRARVKKLQEALIQNFLYDYKESGNETLISQLKNFLNDEDFIRTLPKKTLLAVEHGLARENPHIVRENLENIEQIASEIEKLDPKGVTPDMRRVIAHMEELNVRQEKELLEIKGLYEELVGKWEKMHGEKSGALFPERYTVGNKSKETDLPTKSNLKEASLKNIEPNPAFGENFSEFEGKGAQAVAKLLKEQRGQVAGAFYREDLGYIDLVWGDSKKGLAHILERRTQQYGEQQALEFIHNLPRMLQEAKLYKELENKIELVTPTDMIVLGKRGDNKFVLTGFKDRRSKDRFKELENPQTRDDVGFTGKSVSEPQTKDDVLLPNQDNNTKPPLKKDKPRGKEITPDIKWHLTRFSAGAKAKLLRKDFKTPSMFAPSYLNLSPQATKALQPLLKGGKLEYAFESVHQLIRHHTEQYPYMQMALEAPDIILKDKKDALTFVKEFQETTYSIRLVKNAQNQKWHVKNAMPSDSKALQAMVKDGGQVLLGKNLLKVLKVGPNPAFGENFGEFAGNGTEAVKKLLQEKRGQVAGAFYREDLGYIDLVWGAVKDEKGKIKGHGLSKILEKHIDDFSPFAGSTPLEKLGNGINEIMRSGEVVKQEGDRIAIIQKRHHKTFRIGLKNNWKGEPTHNHWIITAYYDKREP